MASSEEVSKIEALYSEFVVHPENEAHILTTALGMLDDEEFKILEARIKDRKEKKAGKTPIRGGTEGRGGARGGARGGRGGFSGGSGGTALTPEDPDETQDITADELERFWNELEKLDPTTLLEEDVLDAFKYIGFNPDLVLQTFMARGKAAGKDSSTMKKDLVKVVTIAIIKGSITDNNLQKTSDTGKVIYRELKDTYKFVTGGAKGKDSKVLTVARVAAAVPGLITQVLVKKPKFAKTFAGPFGSKSLPPYLRHQAAAACIPEAAPERLKDFLLGLITAFTADQTKNLSSTKSSAEELYDLQQNFVQTTFDSNHPKEETRKKIFQSFSLSGDYLKLQAVGQKIKKVKSDFAVLTQSELDDDLSKM